MLNFKQWLKPHRGYPSHSLSALLSHSLQPTLFRTPGKWALSFSLLCSALQSVVGTMKQTGKSRLIYFGPCFLGWTIHSPVLFKAQFWILDPTPLAEGMLTLSLAATDCRQQWLWWNELVFRSGQDPARLDLSKNSIDTTIHRFKKGREHWT